MTEIRTTKLSSPEDTRVWMRQFGEYLPDPLSKRIDVDAYTEKLLAKGAVFLAMAEEMPLGLAAMYANNHITKKAYISLLAVRPTAQGHGIGRALVDVCVAHAAMNAMIGIRVQTLESNRHAMRLYERAGFRRTGFNGQKVSLEKVLSHASQ